jgi:uncharacterized protein (TIGR00661 family)
MKILYGINGTGRGHIIKSTNIIHDLKYLGHDVDILVSGTNHQVEIPYEVKYQFHGVSFIYNKDGGIDWVKTISNLKPIDFVKDIKIDVSSYDRVVTDFEPISAWSCKLSKKDCFGVSHQYSFLSGKVPRPKSKSFIGEFVINKLAPVSHPIGLHFEKYDSFIDYPVIRGDIKLLTPYNKKHYTVYLPSYGVKEVFNEFSKYSQKFEIFASVKSAISYKNIKIFPNSKSEFINSFINCEGVITSGGFETPSEALFLKKKIMVIPIKGQYEQLCNAEALKRMGVVVGNKLSDVKYLFDSDRVNYKWEDPIPNIIKEILK